MECDILDSLEQLGYEGPLLQEKALLGAAEGGLCSGELVELVSWLSSSLKPLCGLEESIASEADDVASLRLEVSGLLKELHCPFEDVVSGILSGSQRSTKDYLKCVLFLCSELQSAQIINSRKTLAKHQGKGRVHEELKTICDTLKLPEAHGMDAAAVFSEIHSKVEKSLKELPKRHCGNPVLKNSLSSEQWEKLQHINKVLSSEYECRRRMLLKRLDVTIQSFGWSDRAKVKVDSMARAYQPKRHSLRLQASVDMCALLAAREDICNVVKTSSGSSREKTACAVNKVLMGRVPDRGGRPSEIEPPPPEMPPWQKRQDGGGGRGWSGQGEANWRGGRGGGEAGRGGGSWNQGHGGGHGGYSGHRSYGGGHSGHGGKRGRYQY